MSRFVDFKAVKAAVTMLQVLEHYGLAECFRRSSNSLIGPCPLHDGQNGMQFRVSLERNWWNCFGTCKNCGNVLDFVARKEGCSLTEAALALCDWFQLPTQEKPEWPPDNGPNHALGFALQNLDPTHPYLEECGLGAQSIAEFGLGYCYEGSMAGRIVVPIHNAKGQLLTYAGRWPGTPPANEPTPKYKLPPGFRKTREVFNLHRAMRRPRCAALYIVNGFFDCIWLWQHGIQRAVALMGTALSPVQAALIQSAVTPDDRIVVMLDEDDAGRAGREKVVNRFALHCFVRAYRFQREGEKPSSLSAEQLSHLLT